MIKHDRRDHEAEEKIKALIESFIYSIPKHIACKMFEASNHSMLKVIGGQFD